MGFIFLRRQRFDNGVGKILFDKWNFRFGKNDFYINAGLVIRKFGFSHPLLYIAVICNGCFF